eukprot:4473043-Lingulodinium_polyedra.AAC.1
MRWTRRFRCRGGSQTARSRIPCADQKAARAWSARACDVQAVAAAKRRCNHIMQQYSTNVAQ